MTLARRLFGIDVRSLGLFRMGLGTWILADLALRAQDLTAFFTDDGVLPREAILAHYPPALTVWSLYLLDGSALCCGLMVLVQAICAGLLLVGFRTRLMTALSWIFLVSLDARNPLVIQGGDTMAQLMLFWGMFVPLGGAFSVDRARAEARGVQGEAPAGGPAPVFSAGTLAILVQVFLLYYFAGLHKYQSPVWRDGTAVFNALSSPQWQRAPGAFLASFPRLLELLTHAVLYFEILGPFLLFCPVLHVPVRVAGILGFTALQLGLAGCLMLGLFPFMSTLLMALFIPTEAWDRFPALSRGLARPFGGWLARACSRSGPGTPVFCPGAKESTVVAVLLLYVAAWNLCSLDRDFLEATARRRIPLYGREYRPPYRFLWLGFVLRLNQAMTMFVLPDGTAEWHEASVALPGGTHAALFLDRASFVPRRPDPHLRFSIPRYRWGDFWGALAGHPWTHTHAGAYVCRLYRAEHPEGPAPVGITLYVMSQELSADRARAPVRRRLLLSHLCRVEDGELEP